MSRVLFFVVVFALPCNALCQPSDGWRSAGFGGGSSTLFSQTDGSTIVAAADDPQFRDTLKYLSMSFDNGVTWPVLYQPTNLRITAIAVWRGMVYAGTFDGIYFSADSGKHWIKAQPGAYRSLAVSKSVLVAVVDTMIVVTGDPEMEYRTITAHGAAIAAHSELATKGDTVYWSSAAGVMMSSDSGYHWTRVDSTHSFTQLALANSWIFGVNGNDVERSRDAGRTWEAVEPGGMPPYAIAATGDYVFASELGAESTRTMLSRNGGQTWTLINPDLQPHRLYDLRVSGPNLLASSWNVGTWYKPIADIIADLSVQRDRAAGVSLTVRPQLGATSISLDLTLPAAGQASVSVYDIGGRTVLMRALGMMEEGSHTIALDMPRSSGAYFVRLTCSEGAATTRLLMMK